MYVVSRVGGQPRTRRGDSVPPGTGRGRDIGCPKRCQPRQARGRWHAQRCTAPMFASSRDRDPSFSPPMHTRSMSGPSVGDVQVTGPAVQYFFYALVVPMVFLIFLIARTSPRAPAYRLTRFEIMLAPWLWTRRQSSKTMVLAAITGAGAILCAVANFLPVVTFTSQPLFPGDPFAGPMEHDPTAKVMGLVLGIIVGLLALRRAAGGEGITVPISLLLATVLSLVAVLALADYLSNDSPVLDRFAPAVTAGPGLTLLLIGAAVAWVGCAADLVSGISQSIRLARPSVRPMIQS